MTKKDIAKGLGAGVGVMMLFALIQDMRSEINDLRERIAVIETIIGEKNE